MQRSCSFLRPRSLGLMVAACLGAFILLPVPSAYAATTLVNNEASCLSIGATEYTSGSCRFYGNDAFNVASGDIVKLAVLLATGDVANNGAVEVLSSGDWWTFFDTTNNGSITVASGADLDHIQGSFTNNGSITIASGARLIVEDAFTNNGTITIACGGSVSGTISGTPVKQESCPTARNDSYSTTEDTPLTVAAPGVLANDSDPEGDTLTAVKVSDPAHGTLTLNAVGSFTYTPTANYNGPDSFTYRATDGASSSPAATVTLTVTAVNDAPTATNDSYTTGEDTTLTVGTPGVLVNDSDVDNGSLTAVLMSSPIHGALTFNANGSFEYRPNANFNGTDTFTYKANDGTADSNVVTVGLTVTAANDAPVAANDSYGTAEDTVLTVAAPGLLGNDTDLDGDQLTATVVANPVHGTLTVNANGSFTYTPTANYYGSDSFSYAAEDGNGGSSTATATIAVSPVNDAPTLTVATGASCLSDASGRMTVTVSDVDSSSLTLSASSSNTALVPVTNVVFGGSGASRTVTITAVSGMSGAATVTIAVTDGHAITTTSLKIQAGGNGSDTLTGTNDTDLLFGQNGNDALNGMGGKDLLCGGNGDDRMTGGADADSFDGGKGTDAATDFTAGQGDTKVNVP